MATSTKKRTTSKAKTSNNGLTPSEISFKSAATVRKRRNFINKLSPAKAEIATYLAKNSLDSTYKTYSRKKSLVTEVVNEAKSKRIYFKSLRTSNSTTTSKSSSRRSRK